MGLMQRKNIKKMIMDGEMVVGLTAHLMDPAVVEIAGLTGFDFVRLEGEHFMPDWATIRSFAQAADNVGIPLLMRVNRLDDITALNDLGLAGYQIPHVQTAEQAKKIVEMVKYAPVGARGMAKHVRAQKYGFTPFDEYHQFAAEETLLIVQIEDKQGIENMEDIIAVEGIDVICSGKADISQALGIIGQLGDERVREVESRIISLAKKHGKKLMILGRNKEDWQQLIADGSTTITEHVVDIDLLIKGALEARKEVAFLKEAMENRKK